MLGCAPRDFTAASSAPQPHDVLRGAAPHSETLEIVAKFEEIFAALAPPEAKPRSDDFCFDFPDDVQGVFKAAPLKQDTAARPERLEPVLARSPILAPPQAGEDASVAKAMAIDNPVPVTVRAAQRTPSVQPELFAPGHGGSRSRAASWIAAVTIALGAGGGLGYMAATTPATASVSATIKASPQGGARLRVDYDLRQPAPQAKTR